MHSWVYGSVQSFHSYQKGGDKILRSVGNMHMEIGERREVAWKGTAFWTEEIKKAGVFEKLRHFNDVITGKEAPQGYGDEPVLRDVMLDGKRCDVYHTDRKRGDTFHRIFIHIKE